MRSPSPYPRPTSSASQKLPASLGTHPTWHHATPPLPQPLRLWYPLSQRAYGPGPGHTPACGQWRLRPRDSPSHLSATSSASKPSLGTKQKAPQSFLSPQPPSAISLYPTHRGLFTNKSSPTILVGHCDGWPCCYCTTVTEHVGARPRGGLVEDPTISAERSRALFITLQPWGA